MTKSGGGVNGMSNRFSLVTPPSPRPTIGGSVDGAGIARSESSGGTVVVGGVSSHDPEQPPTGEAASATIKNTRMAKSVERARPQVHRGGNACYSHPRGDSRDRRRAFR